MTHPPPPLHLVYLLICLVIIKIHDTYNCKMVTLHNTHLGQWTTLKMYFKLQHPSKLLNKKFRSHPPPFCKSEKALTPLLCLFINHQSLKSGITFSSQVSVMQLNYCLPCDLTSSSQFISTCHAQWILQALLYRKLYNPTQKKKVKGLISITLEECFCVVNISSCHNQIDK